MIDYQGRTVRLSRLCASVAPRDTGIHLHLLQMPSSDPSREKNGLRLKCFQFMPISPPRRAIWLANFPQITPNLEMAERFRRWLIAQKYSSSTQERYCRVARKLCYNANVR